jgi:tetratricopeptide (TPR) repeat protein
MILAVVAGALCVVAVSLLARPFLTTRRPLAAVPAAPVTSPPRALLRQLRDLDEDLGAGKLSAADHRRLRAALERQLAPLLHERPTPHEPPVGNPAARSAAPGGTAWTRRSRRVRWTRRLVALGAAVAAVATVAALLADAVATLPATPAAAPPAPAAEQVDAAGGMSANPAPSAAELAAVDDAVARVRQHPGSAAAHLELARAYARAGQPQLATVEYLAVTRLDAVEPEANTALALVAFKSGSPGPAKAMVDRALSSRPGYPEALYTRGLIQAMGLHRPRAAKRDFEAYLEQAPFGSHRASVETLLAMVSEGGPR